MFSKLRPGIVPRMSFAVAVAASVVFAGVGIRAWANPSSRHRHASSKRTDNAKLQTDAILAPRHPRPRAQPASATLQPTPRLRTDPDDHRASLDVFTDVDPVFVTDKDSVWYESWMMSDLRGALVDPGRRDDHVRFGVLPPGVLAHEIDLDLD